MAYANGRLPRSALAPIAGGYLRKDAALRWNAMNFKSRSRYGVTLMPSGPQSSYRNYAGQVYFWNLYQSGRGNLAARPGTSNHGLGLAVDLRTQRMRQIVDEIGRPFGFAKAWSDAQNEWWHIKWAGFGSTQGGEPKPDDTVIRKGSKPSEAIRTLQVLLRQAGYLPSGWHAHEKYTIYVRRAARKFQKEHNIPVDGVIGPKTWAMLRKAKKVNK